ncbi:MAG: orotate phosphoribosyltransferase [Myxococcota bacterium]|nr:orotate phosphoribosyltransferase [Myxococcota bacterium]
MTAAPVMSLPDFGGARAALLEMIERHAVRRGTFKLASGRTSDFFIDCKSVVLSAEGHVLCGVALAALARAFDPVHAYAGVALGGCALASAASFASALLGEPVPALYVRKEPKDHGTGRLVEGTERLSGRRVVLLEDVVTTGGSTIRAAEALRGQGLDVAGAACIVDRVEGGREALDAAGLPLRSLFTRGDFQ